MDLAITVGLNTILSQGICGRFFLYITEPSHWYAPLGVMGLALLVVDVRKGVLALLAAALLLTVGDALAHQVVKPFIARVRPCHEWADQLNILVGCTQSWSFPSNHAVNAACMAMAIGYFFRRILLFLLSLAILICLSRVAVGAHYFFDVVAGGLGGGLFGYYGAAAIDRFMKREPDAR